MSDRTPYCRRFSESDFEPATLAATREFFEANPWSGEFSERTEKCRKWLAAMGEIYDLPVPALVISPTDLFAQMSRGHIEPGGPAFIMPKHSATTLFFLWRRWMGVQDRAPDNGADARAWSHSLYFLTNPEKYTAAVAAGQIIDPYAEGEEAEAGA